MPRITRILGCLSAALACAPTQAQQLEEIVVTAQRREQNLQQVPISMTAFTGDIIDRANIRGAIDFMALTPNVSFTEDGQVGSRGLGIAIRGVNNLVTGENAVVNSIGIYLDEFSVASIPTQVANPMLPDIERVEVLRGPQGTYFGRNSLGGALNLSTKQPTDELEGEIRVGGESYESAGDQFNITGIVNVPVSSDLKLRGVLFYEDSSGFVENICAAGADANSCPLAFQNNFTPNGAKDSGHEYVMARIRARWDVGNQTTIGATLIYADEQQGHDENIPSGVLDLDTVNTLLVTEPIDPGTGFWPQNRNQLSHDRPERSDLESIVAILNIQHDFNESLTLKSITGVLDAEQERVFDNDLIGGFDTIGRDNNYEGLSWSTELRLEYSSDRMELTVGALYSQDDQEQSNFVNTGPGLSPPHTIGSYMVALPPWPAGLGLGFNEKNFEVESIAAFIDANIFVTDRLDLIAGVRYTHDEVDTDLLGYGLTATCCFPGTPGFNPVDFFQSFINVVNPLASGSESFDDFSPRFGLRYAISDSVNVYGLVSKGYKAGGTSVGTTSEIPGMPEPFVRPFDEETLWNYELGLKSEWLDRRLRVNAAVFLQDWSDLQFETLRFLRPGPLSPVIEQTVNIKSAEGTGFELEVTAVPTEGLSLSAGVGYLDTEIEASEPVELTGGFVVNLEGLSLPKAPEWTANLVADYRWSIGRHEAWIRGEYIHRDGQYSDIEALTNLQTRGPFPNLLPTVVTRAVGPGEFPYRTPDYDVINVRAGYDTGTFYFTAYVQNLTDEKYYTGTQENFGISGIRLRPHPRTFGGVVGFRFGPGN
ncbi:MAG: TonB-dependent receptor [Gammaproteobacteria bacterium]|nr:TonB-dependent receptor [Gammaproteobacteria bacterium]